MSKYTTELRFICESALGLQKQGDYSNIDNAIASGRSRIFTFDYDLFDDEYKSVIETKFLRHFYTREIGFETVGLWKLKLQDKWLMKLPYYNDLWASARLEFNPFNDVDYYIEHEGDGTNNRTDNLTHTKTGTVDKDGTKDIIIDGTDKRTGTEANHTEGEQYRDEHLLDKYSDTPQGELNGVIDTDWLTNARENINDIDETFETDSTTTYNVQDKHDRTDNIIDDYTDTFNLTDRDTGTVGIITTDDYLRHVYGKMGNKSYSELLKEYRKTFMNIDEMFINEMNDLFMLIY